MDKERPNYLPPLPNPSWWSRIPDYRPPGATVPAAVDSSPAPVVPAIPQAGQLTGAPPAPAPDQPAPAAAQAEAKRRVTLVGRVGAVPAFGTTPKGQPKLTFPLAVHPDSETTEWHTVLAFGKRAEQLRGQVKKGDAVEVVGYVHTSEVRGRDGKPKTVAEIYAAAVRKR